MPLFDRSFIISNFPPDFLLQYLHHVNNGVEFAGKMDGIDTMVLTEYDGDRTFKDINILVSNISKASAGDNKVFYRGLLVLSWIRMEQACSCLRENFLPLLPAPLSWLWKFHLQGWFIFLKALWI